MEQTFLSQLQQWHDEDEHQRIVDAVTALPPEERTYELTCLLARAYNNLQQYEQALHLLLSVQNQGEGDPLWHYRLGYAYFYLDREADAVPELEAACRLDPSDEDAWMFLGWCYRILEQEPRMTPPGGEFPQPPRQESTCEYYTEEEMALVEAHITAHFGAYPQVFHELISPDIHLDVCIIEPTAQRDSYTLVTLGMGAHRMNVPAELAEYKLERAELLITLPAHWQVYDSDECWYWPIRCLKVLARLPIQEDGWLGWGHTISNNDPFAPNTQLSGSLLISPTAFGRECSVCPLPDGSEVNFYQIVPLYPQEMDYKLRNDAEALLALMAGQDIDPRLIDPERECACALWEEKNFLISREEIRPLLKDWPEPVVGCIATDRILVDGCPVGYCYREEPDPGDASWDSGWRFFAGDEDEAYLDDPDCSGIYDLNTICNYDPDILPLLTSPCGSAFAREGGGPLHPVEREED